MRLALAGLGYPSNARPTAADGGAWWVSRCPCCQRPEGGLAVVEPRLSFRDRDGQVWLDCAARCDGRRVRLLVGDPTASPRIGRREVRCFATDTCVDHIALYRELGRDT